MEFGKIYFSRVANILDPKTPRAEDLLVFGVVFEHFNGEAATVRLECLYPQTGLLSGPRFGVLSIDVDGVETEIARGQIVGHPVALPGQPVSVELLCRRPDHDAQIDALYLPFDNIIPSELADTAVKRRSEPYVSATPYIDPVSLEAELNTIAGLTNYDKILVGENFASEPSQILSMNVSITNPPPKEVEFIVDAFWTEERIREVDLFSTPANAVTLTPNALRSSLQSPVIDGSGFQFLEASLTTTPLIAADVVVSERKVDPFTCIVTPAVQERIMAHRIDNGTLNVLASAEQPRREILKFRMIPLIQDIGGGTVITENISLGNIDARQSYFDP